MMRLHVHGWTILLCAVALVVLTAGPARAADATTDSQATKSAGDMKATSSTQDTSGTQAAKVQVGTTLENLKTAFNGESNAHARYLAFAKKADEEGYKGAASLFRAAARAEAIHAQNHAAVIKKMTGQEPKAELNDPAVQSTKENLATALKGETYESTAMYPAFLKKARAERNRDAIRTFNGALQAEKGHATYYADALKNRDTSWKAGAVDFYICPVCGKTVTQADFNFAKCPICFTPKEKFEKVA